MDHMFDVSVQNMSTAMLVDLVRNAGLVQSMSAEVINDGSALTAIRVLYRTLQNDKEAIVSRTLQSNREAIVSIKEIEEIRERTSRGIGLWARHYERLAIKVAMKIVLVKICKENAQQLLATQISMVTQNVEKKPSCGTIH